MVKKLFLLAFGLTLAMGASAQWGSGNPTVPQDSIRFWTGTGSNRAVIAVTWDDDVAGAIGIAWGVQWNGTATIGNLMDTIATYDPRMSISVSGSFLNNITYNDTELGLNLIGIDGWWWYNWLDYNDNSHSSGGITADVAQNGDFVDWMQTSTADVMLYATDPNAPAVADAEFNASDILYWVGEGSNEVVLAVNWADTALAWGYRFNGESTTVSAMMSAIADADSRFSYVMGQYGLDDINFFNGTETLGIAAGNYWYSLLNHVGGAGMYDVLHNGDFYKWGDLSVAVIVDSTWVTDWGGYWDYTYVWPYTIHPVSAVVPTDADITAGNILYWVGEGSNEVVLAVNWADTALAWGYRFNGESTTVSAMMDDIAAADPRFSYVTGQYGLDDINFFNGTDTLGIAAGNYWWSLLNHVGGAGMYDVLHNGDFYKWGDLSVAVIVDSTWVTDWGGYWDYTYVWPYTIHPVSVPGGDPTTGPFCGAVGTDGCTAISCTASNIFGWAESCTLVLGPRVLGQDGSPTVDYGTEADAVGPATTNTMDVVSLGDGGSATVSFGDHYITNGEGYDFAVFENSFNDYFLELAFVEVSSNGVDFVRFPATSLTQTNTQIVSSVDPTFINNLAGKYRVGYGTPFDLDELRDSANIDINHITHVRVIDVVGSIDPALGSYDAFGHIINDPYPTDSYSSGFDLDGVCILHGGPVSIAETDGKEMLQLYPNPAKDAVSIICRNEHHSATVDIYDMTGRCVYSTPLADEATSVRISTASLSNGVYIVRVGNHKEKLVVRH